MDPSKGESMCRKRKCEDDEHLLPKQKRWTDGACCKLKCSVFNFPCQSVSNPGYVNSKHQVTAKRKQKRSRLNDLRLQRRSFPTSPITEGGHSLPSYVTAQDLLQLQAAGAMPGASEASRELPPPLGLVFSDLHLAMMLREVYEERPRSSFQADTDTPPATAPVDPDMRSVLASANLGGSSVVPALRPSISEESSGSLNLFSQESISSQTSGLLFGHASNSLFKSLAKEKSFEEDEIDLELHL